MVFEDQDIKYASKDFTYQQIMQTTVSAKTENRH